MTEPIRGVSAATRQTPCGERVLTRRPDPDSININRSGRSTYPSKKSVRRTETTPNNTFMLLLSIAVALGGFVIGWLRHDFTAFARAGALLVGFGIIVLSRTFISRTELHPFIGGAETGLNVYERSFLVVETLVSIAVRLR